MELSYRQAEEIVQKLKTIIQDKLDFITVDGIIIASTDESTIGNKEIVLECIEQNKIISAYLESNNTRRKRLLLPINYLDNVVGVLGITSDKKDIELNANIILNMTELLIKDYYESVDKQYRRESNRLLIEELLKNNKSKEELRRRMILYGYSCEDYNFVVVFDLEKKISNKAGLLSILLNSIEKRIDNRDLIALFEGKFVVISQTDNKDLLVEELSLIQSHLKSKYHIDVTIGVSEQLTEDSSVNVGYKQANLMTNIATNKNTGHIYAYNSTSLDLLLQEFSSFLQVDYAKHIFKNIPQNEREETKEMILSYVRNNGSIAKTSEDLFIHKNTLQYRLNRIHQKTGYNPRDLKGLVCLYFAIQLDNKKVVD